MGDVRDSGAAATEYGLLLTAVALMIAFVAAGVGLISAGNLKHTGDSVAERAGVQSIPRQPMQAASTLATTVTAGNRCSQHGAYASTATGVRVQCAPGPRGIYRWRTA
jgi:Flp pilus assembly pilin Flp